MKCTPWHSSGSKTIKAQETKAYNTYTAFELTYNAYLRTPGQVTFKYRKDSKTSYIVNGEFKFAVNNKEILVDYKSTVNTSSDWVEYTHKIAEPGMYTLMWIYTKFAEENVTDNLSAEIEVRMQNSFTLHYSTSASRAWSTLLSNVWRVARAGLRKGQTDAHCAGPIPTSTMVCASNANKAITR